MRSPVILVSAVFFPRPKTKYGFLELVDFVPRSIPYMGPRLPLFVLEDNESVIKMIVKGRSPMMRHVPRTHKISLDWLFERIVQDPSLQIKYIPTKMQIVDILTNGSFNSSIWRSLLLQISLGDPQVVAASARVTCSPQLSKAIMYMQRVA